MLVVPPCRDDSYGIYPLARTTWPQPDSENAAPVAWDRLYTHSTQLVRLSEEVSWFMGRDRRASDTDHLEDICEVILSASRQGFRSFLKSEQPPLCLDSTSLKGIKISCVERGLV